MPSSITIIPSFRSGLLNNERELYVYLPPGYAEGEKEGIRYPVLYMQDGQHAFNADERGGSWEAHHTADRLIAEDRIRPLIIVAVANVASARISEYMHPVQWLKEVYGTEGNGDLYERFLAEEVKPYIDNRFRTLTGPQDTGILGSSAGGLVSYNIGFRRPDVFGLVGALCPFFVKPDQQMREEVWISRIYTHKPDIKLWIDVGGAEGFTVMERHVRKAADSALQAGFVPGEDLAYCYVPESGHSQKDWEARLHAPLLFFFGEKGHVVSSALSGPDAIGLEGPAVRFHALDTYDSGFMMTNLNGGYRTADPSVLTIRPDGTAEPHGEGETEIIYESPSGQTVTQSVQVIAGLPERISITLKVEVPEGTPDTDSVYAGIEIPKQGSGLYGGTFEVPRGFASEFRISRGMGLDETDERGRLHPFRMLKAREGLKAEYRVAGWVDQQAGKCGEDIK